MRRLGEDDTGNAAGPNDLAGDAIRPAVADAGVAPDDVRCLVLVEGRSDLVALLRCAASLERDLAGNGCVVVPMSGATNLPRFLAARDGARVAGLFDRPEEPFVRRALSAAGLVDHDPHASAGFYACDRDLEDELIRALGLDAALEIVEASGERRRFDVMRRQPAQRRWSTTEALHRFVGTAAGRKERLAFEFADRIPARNVPQPIRLLLDSLA